MKKKKRRYFKGKTSRGFTALYSSRMIFKVGANLLGLFMPIFLYEIFNLEIKYVLGFYIIKSLLYLFSIGVGAKFLNKIGLRRSLRISTVWIMGFFVVMYFLDRARMGIENIFLERPVFVISMASIATILITLRSIMYWIPYHTDIAKFTNKTNRAKQISLFAATGTSIQAIMPFIAGWILLSYNYSVLFLIVILITLSSGIPLSALPRTRERFSWTYLQTWKEFFSKERRCAIIAYMGDGAESAVGVILWPIFIWELLEKNYFEVGLISSAVIAFTVLLQLITGKVIDTNKGSNAKMLKYGSYFSAFGWVIKIFVSTAFQIFAVSVYHGMAKVFSQTSFDALTYEKASEQGHLVDEYTVIHEMAVHAGKVFMLAIAFMMVFFIGLNYTFILGALATLALNYIMRSGVCKV